MTDADRWTWEELVRVPFGNGVVRWTLYRNLGQPVVVVEQRDNVDALWSECSVFYGERRNEPEAGSDARDVHGLKHEQVGGTFGNDVQPGRAGVANPTESTASPARGDDLRAKWEASGLQGRAPFREDAGGVQPPPRAHTGYEGDRFRDLAERGLLGPADGEAVPPSPSALREAFAAACEWWHDCHSFGASFLEVQRADAKHEARRRYPDPDPKEVTHVPAAVMAAATVPSSAAECSGPFSDARDCPVHRQDVTAAAEMPLECGPGYDPDGGFAAAEVAGEGAALPRWTPTINLDRRTIEATQPSPLQRLREEIQAEINNISNYWWTAGTAFKWVLDRIAELEPEAAVSEHWQWRKCPQCNLDFASNGHTTHCATCREAAVSEPTPAQVIAAFEALSAADPEQPLMSDLGNAGKMVISHLIQTCNRAARVIAARGEQIERLLQRENEALRAALSGVANRRYDDDSRCWCEEQPDAPPDEDWDRGHESYCLAARAALASVPTAAVALCECGHDFCSHGVFTHGGSFTCEGARLGAASCPCTEWRERALASVPTQGEAG